MGTWGDRLGGLDLETTGVDVETARIVAASIAVLDPDGAVVTEWTWHTAGAPIAPVTAEIAQTLRTLFALGIPVAVDNAPLALSILDRECRRQHLDALDDPQPVIDPLVLDREVDRERQGGRNVMGTARHYGVGVDGVSPAVVVARLAQAIARAHPDQVDVVPEELHERQIGWYADQAARFQEHVRVARGDEGYLASGSWPITPAEDRSFEDTQPIPAPPLRPSATVPVFDFTEAIPLAIEAFAPPANREPAWRLAGPPAIPTALAERLAAAPPTEHDAVDSEEPVDEPAPAGSIPADIPPPESLPELIEPPAAERPATSTLDPSLESSKPRRVHVAAAIISDPSGRGLVVRKHGSSSFMQAGGKIEKGESALAALIRELDEELGLAIDVAETEFLGSFEAPAIDEAATTVRAEVFALTTDADLVPRGEIAELRWLESVEDAESVELAPLTKDVLLPLWATRRPTPL